MTENRRKHPRVRASNFAAHLRGPGGRHPCIVENISSGGLFVRTDKLVDVGVQLAVDLVRPGWKRPLSISARVTSRIDPLAGRYARKTPGMGLQFFGKMDEDVRARLLTLLRELGAPETEPEAGSGGLELTPVEPEEELLFEPDLPLWQQVQQLEENAAVFPFDDVPHPAAVTVRHVPPSRVTSAPPPPRRPISAAAPSGRPALVAPDPDRLMLQIRGLLIELSEAQQTLSLREATLVELRGELDIAREALALFVKTS